MNASGDPAGGESAGSDLAGVSELGPINKDTQKVKVSNYSFKQGVGFQARIKVFKTRYKTH